jgi:pimeloyl-ACP methyl ester carboxylesterase
MCEGGYWAVKAEETIRQMNTNHDVNVSPDQTDAYAFLMRNKEDYCSNRTLVRKNAPGEDELIQWAGQSQSFDGRRILMWGRADKLFPFERDGCFYETLFRPAQSLFATNPPPPNLLPNVGHIVPEDAPEAVAETLLNLIPKTGM